MGGRMTLTTRLTRLKRGLVSLTLMAPLATASSALGQEEDRSSASRDPNIVEALETGVILEAGEIDSTTVEVGVFAVVIHGRGERHPVSGRWESLETVRGYIQAINGKTLTLSRGRDGRLTPIALERILTLILVRQPVDSLTVHAMPAPWDTENNTGHRLLAKVGAGIGSGVLLTGVLMGLAEATVEREGDPDADAYRTIGFLLGGAMFGCSVGFPLGVSAVDPHDSLPITLAAGVIPGLAGYSLLRVNQQNAGIGFPLMYIGPIINSLIGSYHKLTYCV